VTVETYEPSPLGLVDETRRVQPVEFRSQVSGLVEHRCLPVQFRDQPRFGDLVEPPETVPTDDGDGCVPVPLEVVTRREVVVRLLGEAESTPQTLDRFPTPRTVVGTVSGIAGGSTTTEKSVLCPAARAYPLMLHTGNVRATVSPIPSASETRTTSSTSLYTPGASSATVAPDWAFT